jgi:beta-glucosidase
VKLMRELGLKSHNFTVSWSRVLPNGTGEVNCPGLDFYDRLVDETLAAGMSPICGMYTWDHPQVLEDLGGWLNRNSADWYAEYATVLFDRLGDRVTHWLTMCEIISFTTQAYFHGRVPPEQADAVKGLLAIHHQLLGQGRAVQAFRAGSTQGEIGNWHFQIPIEPASRSEKDVAAAARMDAFSNGLALDSQLLGEYPRLLVDWYGETWPHEAITEGDMATISTPIDFVGIDYYGKAKIAHDRHRGADGLNATTSFVENASDGLRAGLTSVRDRYGNPPAYIVEIGTAVKDSVRNGKVNDPKRIAYLRDHLIAAHAAIGDGVDLRGAFIWSLLDGWEFNDGLSLRYGLIHVDYETQHRTIKASGHWYRDVIAANGFDLP